jgi:hypothetical protein
MLYLLAPELSSVDQGAASSLLAGAEREWNDTPTSTIGAEALATCNPAAGDGVVFFNPPRTDYASDVEALLEEAAREGAVLIPIAMDAEHRQPPPAAGEAQSFDVVDQIRRRELHGAPFEVIGAAFAREALSMTMPTFVQSRLRLFLCHRRADGEEMTARLDGALTNLHEHVFRDLIDIQAGEQAQHRIDEALGGADALVFLDTPMAGESWWIAHELATALGRNIPIVWVQLAGSNTTRAELHVKPAAEPHIRCDEVELSAARAGELADDILRVAARLAREYGRISLQALRELKRWAAEHGADVQTLDARQQIFQLRHPTPTQTRPYPLRPATDVLQFFGRTPSDADRLTLEAYIGDHGMGPHDQACRAFDAAIMLDPTATGHRAVGEWSVTEHPERFLSSLSAQPLTGAEQQVAQRLLLLGAFPTGDYARDRIIPAVHATATTWFRLGGTVVCGGHPTFVPLLVEAARGVLDESAPDHLVIYQSEWFAAPAQIGELRQHATVIATPSADTREASLTVMRTQMIRETRPATTIAIGGRTEESGRHQPGIDEEIRLVRRDNFPVYLLGAPGGQTSLLAAHAARESTPWSSLGNPLDADANAILASTEDYERAVRVIWAATTSAR